MTCVSSLLLSKAICQSSAAQPRPRRAHARHRNTAAPPVCPLKSMQFTFSIDQPVSQLGEVGPVSTKKPDLKPSSQFCDTILLRTVAAALLQAHRRGHAAGAQAQGPLFSAQRGSHAIFKANTHHNKSPAKLRNFDFAERNGYIRGIVKAILQASPSRRLGLQQQGASSTHPRPQKQQLQGHETYVPCASPDAHAHAQPHTLALYADADARRRQRESMLQVEQHADVVSPV
ncbi:hypothetical protein DFH11DRAFT_1830607 [Phellopilus nigrolimitatus]|nr:hypothetical protein DFH11DRAFT_1830607 [Phellopilus nigrolimitatus]